MNPRPLVLAALLPLALVACKASVDGTIDDRPIPAPDAIAKTASTLIGATWTVVVGGGSGQLCKDLDKGIGRSQSGLLTLNLLRLAFGGSEAIGKGSYPIGTTGGVTATAGVQFLDAACGVSLSKSADSGTITVDSVDANGSSGSFNLLFGSDRITGSFNAALCGADSLSVSSCL